jgi:tRNA A58 N-methylase Trm61
MIIALFVLGIKFVLLVGTLYLALTIYLVFRGSNYVATPSKDIQTIMNVVKKGDIVIDLGFGDGRILEAAIQAGAGKAIGYELDFIRFIHTWIRLKVLKRYANISLRYGDIWAADVSKADVVITFFTIAHMNNLYAKMKKEMKKGTWFVSIVHEVSEVKPTKKLGSSYFYKLT